MKRIILASLLLIIGTTSFCQNPTLKWDTKKTSEVKGSHIFEIIGVDKEGNKYILKESAYPYEDDYRDQKIEISANADYSGAPVTTLVTKRDHYYIEKYDASSKLVYTKEINFPEVDGNKIYFREFHFIDNQIVGFASIYTKSKAGKFRKAYKFNISSEGILDTKSVKEIGSLSTFNKMYAGKFDFSFSPDKSKILVAGTPGAYGGKTLGSKPKRFYAVYDTKFNLLWKKDLTFPHIEKTFGVKEKKVNNSGNITISATEIISKEEANFYSYFYNGKTDELKENKIELKDKKVVSAASYFNDNTGHLIVSGFYAEKGKKITPEGVFYKRIEINSGTEKISTIKKIDSEILTNLIKNTNFSNSFSLKLFYQGLNIHHFYPYQNNGAITMIAGRRTGTRINGLGSVFVLKIDAKGSFIITEGVKLELPSMNMSNVNRRIRYTPSYNSASDDLNIITYDGRLIKNPVVSISFNKTGTKTKKELYNFDKNAATKLVFEPLTKYVASDGKIHVIGREFGNSKHYYFGEITTK
jgi:hypothetical protein